MCINIKMDLILIKTYLNAINYFEEEIIVSDKLVKILGELYKSKKNEPTFHYSRDFLKWYKNMTRQDSLTEFILYIMWETIKFIRYLHSHPQYMLTMNAFKRDTIMTIKSASDIDTKKSMIANFNVYKRSLETINPSTVFMALVYDTHLHPLIKDYGMLPFHKFIVNDFVKGNVFKMESGELYIKRGDRFFSLKEPGGMYYFLRLFKFLETLDAKNYI